MGLRPAGVQHRQTGFARQGSLPSDDSWCPDPLCRLHAQHEGRVPSAGDADRPVRRLKLSCSLPLGSFASCCLTASCCSRVTGRSCAQQLAMCSMARDTCGGCRSCDTQWVGTRKEATRSSEPGVKRVLTDRDRQRPPSSSGVERVEMRKKALLTIGSQAHNGVPPWYTLSARALQVIP